MLKDGFKLGTQTGHPAGEAGTHQSTWEVTPSRVGSSTAGEPPGVTPEDTRICRLGRSKSPTLFLSDSSQGCPSGPVLEEQGKGC